MSLTANKMKKFIPKQHPSSYMNLGYSNIVHTPYCYLIGWSSYNIWYYGRRTAKNCHPIDLWTSYFTSSKEVASFRKLYGEPDIIQIRKIFVSVNLCSKTEERVTRKIYKSPFWLNKQPANAKFDTTGTINVKDRDGKCSNVPCNDERISSGKYVPNQTGMVNVVIDGKIKCISVKDEKYINGAFVHMNTGRKHKTATKEKMSKSHSIRTYETPFGKSHSTRTAIKLFPFKISKDSIRKLCEQDILITYHMLKKTNFPKEWIGKSSRDLGFNRS